MATFNIASTGHTSNGYLEGYRRHANELGKRIERDLELDTMVPLDLRRIPM